MTNKIFQIVHFSKFQIVHSFTRIANPQFYKNLHWTSPPSSYHFLRTPAVLQHRFSTIKLKHNFTHPSLVRIISANPALTQANPFRLVWSSWRCSGAYLNSFLIYLPLRIDLQSIKRSSKRSINAAVNGALHCGTGCVVDGVWPVCSVSIYFTDVLQLISFIIASFPC